MSSSRNFQFRVSPRHGERSGRFTLKGGSYPMGVPVKTDGTNDGLGRANVVLATGDQAKPLPGQGGILVFEQLRYDGLDPVINTYSDAEDIVKVGSPVQVVSGDTVKIALINTTATSFLIRTGYPTARIMVAGVSIATPTVAVGDGLTPGTGDGTSGYWAETSTDANKWLVVTSVDKVAGTVEARINF